MREFVLLQKVYGAISLEQFEEFLKELCKGLKVKLTDVSVMMNSLIKVTFSGEDEDVVVRFLEKEIGLAPIATQNVERFSGLLGSVVNSGQSKTEVFVDVGVFFPKPVYATIPLQRLQGQLVDGKRFALERIVGLFGFVDGFPLEVRIVEADNDGFKAELTEKQLARYSSWVDARTDRLIVLGTFSRNVEEAVKKARLYRDVLGVESLGILEHVVACKLGTDAVGLAPKLGRLLPRTGFVCFSPRRVLELLGERWQRCATG